MRNEEQDKRTKGYTLMRSMMDFGMGILYIGVGVFLAFSEKFGFEMNFDKTFSYIFGGLCFLYGAWRIYRGIRKDYF
jgi:hypothetical protein